MKPVLASNPPSTYQRRKKSGSMPHQQHALLKKKALATLDDFTMSDCYEKLKELVPTIPKDRKVSRVEILQHVIDYIQDLQLALDSFNINVKDIPFPVSCKKFSSSFKRTPFASLQTPSDPDSYFAAMTCTQENLSILKEMGLPSGLSVATRLHPYDTPESSPDSQPCTC